MPNPVVVSDIEARWRPLTEQEKVTAVSLIDDAWEVALQQVPGVEARLTAGTLREGIVVKVISAMVLRVMKNPDGLRQFSVDDGSFTRDQALSAGLLYLADNEVAELAAVPGLVPGSGAYFIGLSG